MPQDKKGGSVPVAQVEDYDSDASRIVPETVVQAWQQHAHLDLKPTDRSSHRRDAATSSRRKPRQQIARVPRSKPSIGYSSSSDTSESDSSAHSSRRPAMSTTASSTRTKGTSSSSMTDYSEVIVESPSGRRTGYLRKEEQAGLVRRLQQQQLDDKLEEQRRREEKVAAYQRDMAGEPYDLTAENVKALNRKRNAQSGSETSRSKTSRSDGIKIKSGDTILHVYGDTKIEMKPGEDGAAPQLVIASSSGRDSGYHSKSSGSRMGRSRVSRRDRVIQGLPETESARSLSRTSSNQETGNRVREQAAEMNSSGSDDATSAVPEPGEDVVEETEQSRHAEQEALERRDDELYKCTWPGCSHKAPLMCEIRKHFKAKHKPDEPRPHGCPHCEKRFIWPKDVRRHLNQRHKDIIESSSLTRLSEPSRDDTREQALSLSNISDATASLTLVSPSPGSRANVQEQDGPNYVLFTTDKSTWHRVFLDRAETSGSLMLKIRKVYQHHYGQQPSQVVLYRHREHEPDEPLDQASLLDTVRRAVEEDRTLEIYWPLSSSYGQQNKPGYDQSIVPTTLVDLATESLKNDNEERNPGEPLHSPAYGSKQSLLDSFGHANDWSLPTRHRERRSEAFDYSTSNLEGFSADEAQTGEDERQPRRVPSWTLKTAAEELGPRLFDQDSTDPDDSDNDSIFSQGSVASSATTASIASIPDEMIQDFVSILFCTDDLREVSVSAINDEAIGAQRYQRNIRRLIAQYGSSLKSESMEGDQAGAARMLQSRSISTRAARDIVKQCNGSQSEATLSRKKNLLDGEGGERDDESEVSVEDQEDIDAEKYDVPALQDFLLQSKAYSEFKEQLVEFVHRSYESRVLGAIGTEIMSEDGKRCPGRESIRAIARDISWAPVRLISISCREDCGLGDYVKGWVEDKIGETWNWWPLQQVKRPLAPASSRIRWQSPFGTPRYVDIPTRAAKALQQVLSSAPAFVNSQNTGTPAQNSANQTRNGNTGISAQSPNSGSVFGTAKHTGSQQHQGAASSGCGSASSLNGQVSQVPQAPDPRHVFLCVRRGTSHNFVDMSTHTMRCDGEFFRALKENYFHLRGWLRRYFSMWQYDRCDFYQFHKFDINKGAPSKESFPPSTNAAYDFLPRPIDPSPPGGPISDQEFRDRFYKSCHHCHSWHLHHRERIRNTATIQHAAKDAIALLPKRKEALQMDDGRREQFWGIFARERRCFAWVLAYGLLFNLPGVIFFFLWLFQWQHASDLQNAAVPVGMSISLTMLFVALLFESREKDRV